MTANKEKTVIVGIGAAACAACCAGPIIGFLAAIGISTAVGVALFGTIGLVAGALALAIVVRRRRRAARTRPVGLVRLDEIEVPEHSVGQ